MNKAYIRFPNFKSKALTLSYDDGVRQDKRLISIMKKNGLKGTFNINSGLFSDSYDGKTEKGRMTVKEALELYIPNGMEIAAHGSKHFSLANVSETIALNDVFTDRKELEKTFGGFVCGMAYANGSYNDSVIDTLRKCGIKYARTTKSIESFVLPEDWLRLSATCHHNNPRLMELAKQFAEKTEAGYWWRNQPCMFYLWGHSYEFDDKDNWNVIEEFAEYMGNRNDIWYATNGEIYDYLQACSRLQFSLNETLVYNPSCTDIYLDVFGQKVMVPCGKTVEINPSIRKS